MDPGKFPMASPLALEFARKRCESMPTGKITGQLRDSCSTLTVLPESKGHARARPACVFSPRKDAGRACAGVTLTFGEDCQCRARISQLPCYFACWHRLAAFARKLQCQRGRHRKLSGIHSP